MAIELPGPVVDFLNFVGVGFPQVNEDSVREFATHVRDFATSIEATHNAATGTVQQMGAAYSGASYEALVARWADMSNSHVKELVDGCHVVATALDLAAAYIEAKKIEALAQFAIMAAEFVADQAAAVATLGIAEAAEVAIVAAARQMAKFLEQELEQYIIGEVIEKALTPLLGVVQKAVGGLVYNVASDVLGGGSGSGGSVKVGASFSLDPEMLSAHADVFDQHADAITSHSEAFSAKLSNLNFG
ncbi:MAG: WXG100 family type VII secretion target [Actinocrinis sp.]